jgi:hypothetical protein
MPTPPTPKKPSRISLAHLARALIFPIVATGITVLIIKSPTARSSLGMERGRQRIALVQKDTLFQPIPPRPGAPTGAVTYLPTGDRFSFRLEASGLVPRRHYELDLTVDGVTYTMASRAASDRGTLAIDTTLTQFAEGACVGANYHQPLAVRGRHRIKFAVKNDGSPSSGTARTHTPGIAAGGDLPCAGNGDENYAYVLFEARIADFEGR